MFIELYLISRASVMETLLRSVVPQEDSPVLVQDVFARDHSVSAETIHALANDLSGFLTLSFQVTAQLWISVFVVLEGFDFWRRVMKPIRFRSEMRSHKSLSSHRPEVSRNLVSVPIMLG